MLVQFHDVARKEFDALVASDEHPNVLRCYAWERSGAWVYLALELCDSTLYDSVLKANAEADIEEEENGIGSPKAGAVSKTAANGDWKPKAGAPPSETTWRIARDIIGGVEVRSALVSFCNCSSSVCWTVELLLALKMFTVLFGHTPVCAQSAVDKLPPVLTLANSQRLLQSLHRKDIIHRDLKPQNILLTADRRAKVSDMGLSKQIAPTQTSFDSYGGAGSSGWQAPEQIIGSKENAAMRQSKATDIFSLALVLFFALSHGQHPYGVHGFERDNNIVTGEANLSQLDGQRELQNVLRAMLHKCACL